MAAAPVAAARRPRARDELIEAQRLMLDRGMRIGAKWISEHLVAVTAPEADASGLRTGGYAVAPEWSLPLTHVEVYANALTHTHEFLRAAHVLDSHYGGDMAAYPDRLFFTRCYALYMDGERRKEAERSEMPPNLAAGVAAPSNPQLSTLLMNLAERARVRAVDAFEMHMHGIVLREVGRREDARRMLHQSCIAYPMNWSAWLDLASVIVERAELDALELPDHWMTDFFRAYVLTELQANAEALRLYEPLSAAFPASSYLQAQTAKCLYNMRRLDDAQTLFDAIAVHDPYRVDDVDTYSNILYVKGNRAALSTLAHTALRLDKYRPETCCAIGNYYSLRGEREKAVLYFRRALRLKPRYNSAWTLMGHEYVELKNTAAAIECYRKAVDANARDYRAWYGLGQTYELLQMHQYAAYYYRRATTLRPFDERVWLALGQVYEHLQRLRDAIACYERAADLTDREGTALLKIAQLYKSMNDAEAAAKYYAEFVEEREADQTAHTQEVSEALLYLARHAASDGRLDAAEAYATRVLFLPYANDVFEARNIIAGLQRAKERHATTRNVPAAAGVLAGSPVRALQHGHGMSGQPGTSVSAPSTGDRSGFGSAVQILGDLSGEWAGNMTANTLPGHTPLDWAAAGSPPATSTAPSTGLRAAGMRLSFGGVPGSVAASLGRTPPAWAATTPATTSLAQLETPASAMAMSPADPASGSRGMDMDDSDY